MKYFTVLPLFLGLPSIAMAATPPARISLCSNGCPSPAAAVGAAYFMTNQPSGNYLVSATVEPDGTLALYEAVYTEGTGGHGVRPDAIGPLDALFSQGSIGVSAAQRFVANVNAGSNTVTVFAVNTTNPAQLNVIGKPISSGGEFPTSLAINKAGNRLCVVNGGRVSGVSCYTFAAGAGLTPLSNTIRSLNLDQTTPPTGPSNTPSQVIFSPDEKQLIVSVKSGYLAVWNISPDGSLSTNFQTVTGGILPFSLSYVPGKNAIIASDPGVGYDIFNMDTNTAVSLPIAGQTLTCWSVFSGESGNFYMIDVGVSTITEVEVTSSLGSSIVKQYTLGHDGPIDTAVATVNNKDFMYSLAANATGITVLSVNGPGQAKISQRVNISGPAQAANLALDSSHLQGMATFIGK
ncbi:hypothetical protein B0H16DRAFT_113823 [Mycena metata]|uniref:3-carboxymuconate cyclase n=1 Tax=Mycena metata TaxID=1033252 RepID=A0AAD7K1M6_9AGAR|nr:hypothetical protein B0H16DRAFT_113823 [Mycena metata]